VAPKKTDPIEGTAAPAAPASVVVDHAPARPRMPGLAIAGVVVGGVIVAGALFGGGVLLGEQVAHPHGGAGTHQGFSGGGDNGFGGHHQNKPGQNRPGQDTSGQGGGQRG